MIALVIIVIAAAGLFFAMSGKKNPADDSSGMKGIETPITPANNGNGQFNGTISDLLGRSVPSECTFSMDTSASGTVYTANGQARMDITMNNEQGTIVMHAVVRDGFEYTWFDSGPMKGTGMKLDVNKAKAAAKSQAPASAQSVDTEKNMDMNCSAWATSASVFELPAGINFQDITQLIPGSNPGSSPSAPVPNLPVNPGSGMTPPPSAPVNPNLNPAAPPAANPPAKIDSGSAPDPCQMCKALPATVQAQCLQANKCSAK